jgi:hypothetical protein
MGVNITPLPHLHKMTAVRCVADENRPITLKTHLQLSSLTRRRLLPHK